MLYILSLKLPFYYLPLHTCFGTVWCIFVGGRGHIFCVIYKYEGAAGTCRERLAK